MLDPSVEPVVSVAGQRAKNCGNSLMSQPFGCFTLWQPVGCVNWRCWIPGMPRGDARARSKSDPLVRHRQPPVRFQMWVALAEAKSQHPRLPWQERTAKAICAKTW